MSASSSKQISVEPLIMAVIQQNSHTVDSMRCRWRVFRTQKGIKRLSEVSNNVINIFSDVIKFSAHTFLPQTFTQYDLFYYVIVLISEKHDISLGFLIKFSKEILPVLISYKSRIHLVTQNPILRQFRVTFKGTKLFWLYSVETKNKYNGVYNFLRLMKQR